MSRDDQVILIWYFVSTKNGRVSAKIFGTLFSTEMIYFVKKMVHFRTEFGPSRQELERTNWYLSIKGIIKWSS